MSSASKRLFEALDAIASEPGGLGVSDLARELNVSKATASRMLASLVEAGLINKTASQRHVLDFRLWVWGLQASSQARRIAEIARPMALHVSRTANVHVATTVLYARQTIFVEICIPSHGATVVQPGANPLPAYACAPGKVMLAYASQEKKDLALEAPLKAYTNSTLTTTAAIEEEFAVVREKGYALNRQEYVSDTVGVAVPIFDGTGEVVAAVSSSGPASAWTTEGLEGLVPMLKSISDSVSAALGFSRTAVIVG
jgi:DNA-binding IclR family transcriptional regulator